MLGRMMEDIHKYRDIMGETGAGIVCEKDIDMGLNNLMTQSWGKCL
jgi:hypothetical protein